MTLSLEFLDLSVWDRLDAEAAGRAARSLVGRLPPSWRFARVQRHAAVDQRRFVAFLAWQGVEFALIPGGFVTLGFDRSRPPQLTEEDVESWELARCEYGEVTEHLDRTTTPLRQVLVAPFLLEVASREMHREPGSLPDGTPCLRSVKITTRQVREQIHQDGFRLPTSDEWEHACRGGTRTFWWWGDCCPTATLPARNAFGVQIAWNTYRSEWCTHPDVFRGGDGGYSCCGGLDGFPTTLRLASAYHEPFSDAGKEDEQFYGDCRRAFPLC